MDRFCGGKTCPKDQVERRPDQSSRFGQMTEPANQPLRRSSLTTV
jgi:hypothetical protein